MNSSDIDKTLDTRGCCETGPETTAITNRPGRSALEYRIGIHSTFLRSMLNRLHRLQLPDGENKKEYPLDKLATRSGDDPSIAMLELLIRPKGPFVVAGNPSPGF